VRAQVGPLSRLAACLLPVVGAFAVDDTRQGLICLLAELLALGWLATDVRSSLARFGFGVFASGSIVISTYLYGGRDLDEAIGAGLRVLVIVLPAALLTPSIDPSGLGDHLAQRLRLPGRAVVAATAALQRLDDTVDTWRTIQRARRARGLGLDGSPARRVKASGAGAFALLVVSLRQTATTTLAMDARGFATATRRTWAEPAPWTGPDSLVLLLALGLAVLPWLLGPV
jgi:energy-coupling factor transporter transmembrane protein EcfT